MSGRHALPDAAIGLLGPRPGAYAPIRTAFQVWGQSASWQDLMNAGERIEALGFASLSATTT